MKTWPYLGYGPDMVPVWCEMALPEHETMGGCWGISSGQQVVVGEDYCRTCELYRPDIKGAAAVNLPR